MRGAYKPRSSLSQYGDFIIRCLVVGGGGARRGPMLVGVKNQGPKGLRWGNRERGLSLEKTLSVCDC